MKKILISALFAVTMITTSAVANDVKIFYTNTCPHCHNAREFFAKEIRPEYKSIRITEYNLDDKSSHPAFRKALTDCKYENGYVPVIMVGEKCWQGYGPSSNPEIIDAVKNYKPKPKTEKVEKAEKKSTEKSSGTNLIPFYALMGILVLGLGFILLRKPKK